jgi:hypothetical protein
MAMPVTSMKPTVLSGRITLHCISDAAEQTCLGVSVTGRSRMLCQHSTNHTSSVYEFDLGFPVPASVHQRH